MLSRVRPAWRTFAKTYAVETREGIRYERIILPHRHRHRQCFSTRSDQASHDATEQSHVRGTVTTTASGSAEIAGPLQEIRSRLAEQRPHLRLLTQRPNTNPGVLLVLHTPSYAAAALDPDLTTKLLNDVKPEGGWRVGANTISAVVDKICGPDGEPREGIAYYWRPRGPKMRYSDGVKDLPPGAQKPGWLEFEVARARGTIFPMVQLPLARTIFSTGGVSTMIKRRYRPNDGGALELTSERNLERFRFRLQKQGGKPNPPNMHAPLVPLTPARSIGNIMGNIIRTVSVDPPSDDGNTDLSKTQPASQELEQAVTDYFTARELSPQPVLVWALIMPEAMPIDDNEAFAQAKKVLEYPADEIRASWTRGTSTLDINNTLSSLLAHGARLCKVLSGGGGWGKKAGLLSLDPDSSYSTRELRQDEGWDFDLEGDVERQKSQALGEIATKGERVMFLIASDQISRTDTSAVDVPIEPIPNNNNNKETAISAIFGTLPSSIDSIPEPSPQSANQLQIQYHPDILGAFSETGLALTTTAADGSKTQTKFDVPFSRISATYKADERRLKGPSHPRFINVKRQMQSPFRYKRGFSTTTIHRKKDNGTK